MTERFDWNADESVVLPEQRAVAVYLGEVGDVIIRQEGLLGLPDTAISVRPHYALNLCAAILREAGLHGARIVDLPFNENELVGRDGNLMHLPSEDRERFDPVTGSLMDGATGKDATAAERKRRQRQKQREAKEAAQSRPVTPVSVTVTTAPRLPAELDLLQHQGGAKQPAG